ncbi:MAG: hypothetical protein JWR16_3560 [Nevskia sp.]|nr:hypothetical protein [Nevskia sp.]
MSKINSATLARHSANASRTRWAGVALAALTLALAGCNNKDFTAYALTSTGTIVQFATNKPTKITNKATVTGLSGSDSLVQIAFNTAGTLYGVTTNNEICTVDPLAGAVSGCTTSFTTDRLSNIAASFDPISGKLRVIANDSASSSGHLNFAIDPTSAAVDTNFSSKNLNYADSTNGAPQIAAISYDNPIAGASTTTLFALDINNQSLDHIGDKNVGANSTTVAAGGVEGIGATNISFTSNVGLAIAPQDGTAYAVLGNAASLYTIDLGNGGATLVDVVHDGDYTLISLTIAPNS